MSAQLWEHFIDIEDLTLNSLHTTLVFVLRLKHKCSVQRI